MLPILAVLAIAFGALAVVVLLRYPAYRGKRIVTCPETQEPAAADIDAWIAARTEVMGEPRVVICNCSRWPEKAGCDQACAPQIAAAPRDTLVRSIVARWYRERCCAYCGKAIADVGGSIVPGLRDAEGHLREWRDVPPEELPRVLAASRAVCTACEVAESFRREFPQRVIDRPATPLRHRGVY